MSIDKVSNPPAQDPATNDDANEFVERMRRAFEVSSNTANQLNELYRLGELDELKECIDDIAHSLAERDPEYADALQMLRVARDSRNSIKEHQIMEFLISERDKYIKLIISEAGLPDEAELSAVNKAHGNVAAILDRQLEAYVSPEAALYSLGVIHNDEEGQKTYNFPTNLVPDTVNSKWETYLAAVCLHVRLMKNKDMESSNYRDEVGRADSARKLAHDSLAKDLHEILGFQERFGWDFLDTRRLIACMRESYFPTQDIAYSQEYSNLIDTRQDYLRVAAVLAQSSTAATK